MKATSPSKCRALRAGFVVVRSGTDDWPSGDAGRSGRLYDREMKEAANWDGLRFRDRAQTSVKLPARTALI
jgi:hypothetical protein